MRRYSLPLGSLLLREGRTAQHVVAMAIFHVTEYFTPMGQEHMAILDTVWTMPKHMSLQEYNTNCVSPPDLPLTTFQSPLPHQVLCIWWFRGQCFALEVGLCLWTSSLSEVCDLDTALLSPPAAAPVAYFFSQCEHCRFRFKEGRKGKRVKIIWNHLYSRKMCYINSHLITL